jgi:hypothetical protein
VAALVRQHRHADPPAAVQRSEQAVGRHTNVGEEDLVELGLTGHLAQRANLDAGRAHVEKEERDSVVAPVVGSARARHEDAPLAVAAT